jgi:hypothetical protein
MNRKLLILACAALFVSSVGCFHEEDTGGDPGGLEISADEATAQKVMTSVVGPLLETVNLQTYTALLGATPIAMASQCDPLPELCSSGSAELCPGELGGLAIHLTNCGALSTSVDGTITFVGTPTAGTAALSLALNDNTGVVGNVAYMVNEECFTQTFSEMTVTLPDLTVNFGGFIDYCNPTVRDGLVVPTAAEFEFVILEQARVLQVSMYSGEQAGDYDVTVLNQNRTQILLSCNGNLFGGISCFVPQEGL